jgi:hypothetical protein
MRDLETLRNLNDDNTRSDCAGKAPGRHTLLVAQLLRQRRLNVSIEFEAIVGVRERETEASMTNEISIDS